MAIESLLTFAAEGILTKVASLVAQELSLAWGFKDELTKLGRSLSILQDFLGGAAEQAQHGGKAVKDWVNKLNDIVHDADDVLDEINYEVLRKQVELQNHMKKKVCSCFSSSNPVVFRFKMAHRIKNINKSLVELKGEASFIGLVAKKRDPFPQVIRSGRPTNSVIGEKEIIVGRREVVLGIVKTLTNSTTNQESLLVMAIVGMAGLGKTTVAKSVYNEDSIDKYFQKKIWVCVSNTFEVNSILSQILESLNSQKVMIKGQDALLKNLKEELKESRYLLILDDVWNDDSNDWDDLKSCLSNLSVAGSKIIVTTRSAQVAVIVETLPRCNLESISVDDCWSIIKDKALPDNSEVPFAEDIDILGKQIAERCAGIPLMAKVLGSILSSKKRISEWQSIKESIILNLPDVERRVISVLRLSFDNLASPSLKQCFVYCSMFLKDTVIERDNLVQLWMAQGLLLPAQGSTIEEDERNLELEDIGNEYFDVLLQSSLFQDATTDEYGIAIKCKMHDLVHDLAELVSKSERLTGDFQETDRIVKVQQVAQVSSSMLERIRERNVGRLHSLFSSHELPTEMLPGFGGLRVLNLYEAEIQELPTSIGKLKHLRYLNISRTSIKALPTSIGKLYNLQTLRAANYALEEFPKEVLSLINLRHIYFHKSTKFPVGMGQLTHLRTIPPFYVDEDMGRGIEELGGLNELKGDLIIYNLEQVQVGDEARKAELKEKKNVKHLKLVWTKDRSVANNHDEDVAEGLQPHHALESLTIVGFMGAKLPSWLMSRSLPLNNLYMVELERCDSCEELPSLGHLLNLTTLRIYRMDNLKCLGKEFYGHDLVHGVATASGRTRTLFPTLKKLTIHYCKKLFEWVEFEPTSSERVVVFPCLEELRIQGCPKLRNVPSHFPSLKKLTIEELTCLPKRIFLNNNNNLISVEIRNCDKLRHLPDGLDTLALLQTLNLWNCESLEMIVITQSMPSLQELKISGCSAISILSGLQYCTSLQELEIWNCNNLTSIEIPAGASLTSLEKLTIGQCHKLSSLPALQQFPSLQNLFITTCPDLKSFSSYLCGEHLTCPSPEFDTNATLEKLSIRKCESLHSIPDLQSFTSLRRLTIIECGRISESLVSGELNIPGSVEELQISSVSTTFLGLNNLAASLRTLEIMNCEEGILLGGLERLARLHKLSLFHCSNLTSIEITNGVPLPSLQDFGIHNCPELSSLPALHHFPSLRTLDVRGCPKLTSISSSSISRAQSDNSSQQEIFTSIEITDGVPLPSLQQLAIRDCPQLSSLPALHHFPSLRTLDVRGCPKLTSISSPSISHAQSSSQPEIFTSTASLELLWIHDCDNLQSIPDLYSFTSLRDLSISRCGKLQHFPTALNALTHLKECTLGPFWEELDSFPDILVPSSQFHYLQISGWPKLKSLPTISATSLKSLGISHFDAIEALPECLGDLASLTELGISDCENLKYLPSVKAMKRLTNLQSLFIRGCPLLADRCKEKSGPEWPKISHIPNFTVYYHR